MKEYLAYTLTRLRIEIRNFMLKMSTIILISIIFDFNSYIYYRMNVLKRFTFNFWNKNYDKNNSHAKQTRMLWYNGSKSCAFLMRKWRFDVTLVNSRKLYEVITDFQTASNVAATTAISCKDWQLCPRNGVLGIHRNSPCRRVNTFPIHSLIALEWG